MGARGETGRLMECSCSSLCKMRPWKEEIRKERTLKGEDELERDHYEVEIIELGDWWHVREKGKRSLDICPGFQPGKLDWSIFVPFITASYLYCSLW